MATPNPYAQYKEKALNTTSPAELTLMLYNGCLKFIKQSRQAMENKDYETKNYTNMRAQAIIKEFMVTLETDSEIGKNLLQMYDYLINRLVEANIKNDATVLDEVEGFVIELRDTWKEAMQIDRKERHGEGITAQKL